MGTEKNDHFFQIKDLMKLGTGCSPAPADQLEVNFLFWPLTLSDDIENNIMKYINFLMIDLLLEI